LFVVEIRIPVCFHKGWAWARIHSSGYKILWLFSFVEKSVNDVCYEVAKTLNCSEKLSRSDDWAVVKKEEIEEEQIDIRAAKV
jgi:hypothetical protein